jgi:hypothetical protein
MYFVKSDRRINTFLSFTLFLLFSISVFPVSALEQEVILTWKANNASSPNHYIVYWGFESGNYIYNSGNIGLANEYVINIPNDAHIYFTVTTVDNSGLESEYSKETNNIDAIELTLKSGWNLISVPELSENIPVEEAFGPIIKSIINISAYENKTWNVYQPDSKYNTLTEIKSWQGLWVNMRSEAILTFIHCKDSQINLKYGWNLVSFNSYKAMNVSNAITLISQEVESIWSYQKGKWMVYDPMNPDLSDLTILEPGPGYWINVKNSCIWTR